MEIVTIETPELGNRSYLVHDGTTALVVDPQRDIDRVVEAAVDARVRITHVAETHLHNDYVSGGLTLAHRTGATYLHAGAVRPPFAHTPVGDGDRLDVGDLDVEVVRTPGHTHHHLAYVVRHGDDAPAVLTGGSLLLGTVGRTDLLRDEDTVPLTRAQHRSARRLADELPDETRVLPTHGFGSFCSSLASGEESDGTMGCERSVNVALTVSDEDEFVRRITSGPTARPDYYAHMAPLNLAGAQPADLSPAAPIGPDELGRRLWRHEWVVDLRPRRAHAAEHLAGTVGMELADQLATYLGWLAPWGMPVTLLGSAEDVSAAQRQLVRIGIDRPAGAMVGVVPAAWAPDLPTRTTPVADFETVARGIDGVVLDVRRDEERDDAAIPGSLHVPIHEVTDHLDDLPDQTLWVHCASGYRASIAASLLDRAGHDVVLIDDVFDHAVELDLAQVTVSGSGA